MCFFSASREVTKFASYESIFRSKKFKSFAYFLQRQQVSARLQTF